MKKADILTTAMEKVERMEASEEAAVAAAQIFSSPQALREFEDFLYPGSESLVTEEERRTIHSFVASRCRKQSMEERLALFILERQDALISAEVTSWRLAAAKGARGAGGTAAGGAAGGAGGMAGGEDVTFVFVSGDGARRGWRAKLDVPAGADADTPLDLFVTDGEDKAVDGGIFRIAGVALPLVAGRSAIPFGMFLSGMKETKVSLTFEDGLAEGGSLAFM